MNLQKEESIIWLGVPDKPVKPSLSFLVLSFPWHRPPRSTQHWLQQVSISKWGKHVVVPKRSPKALWFDGESWPRETPEQGRQKPHWERVHFPIPRSICSDDIVHWHGNRWLLMMAQPLSDWPRWARAHVLEKNPCWQLHLPSIHGSLDSFIYHSCEHLWLPGISQVCVCVHAHTRVCMYGRGGGGALQAERPKITT